MTVGLALFELHFTEGRSLKQKRMVLNRLKSRLSGRLNVSVAEVDHQDLWQRSTLAVVAVAAARTPVEETLRAAEHEIEKDLPGELLDVNIEFLSELA